MYCYRYDAWGYCTITATSGISATDANVLTNITPFRYRGYYYDVETGLYYLQSRYYDPEIGRFINADDVACLGANGDLQAFNLYAYCSNNPVAYIDVTGEFIGALVGGFIGAISGAISGYISAVQSGGDIEMAMISGAITGATIGAMGAAVTDPLSLALVSVCAGAVAVSNDIVNQAYNYDKELKANNQQGSITDFAQNVDWGSLTYSFASNAGATAVGGIVGIGMVFENVPRSITTTIARDVVANVHGSLIVGGLQMVGDLIYSIARS